VKRILYDVPRWHIYLYRRELGLPLVDRFDSKDKALADEIFEKLYAGEPEAIDPEELKKLDEEDLEWAQREHAQMTNSDEFKAAAKECKGNYAKAATTAKAILDARQEALEEAADAMDGMRQQLASAAPTGSDRDAADGLDQVQVAGMGGWGGEWKGEDHANDRAKSLAERLKDNEKLKRIALLAGKFKRIVLNKQKARVKRGADEISDITQGDNIAQLLPSELVRLCSPRYRLSQIRDLMERKCLQYQMTSMEVLGRGPVVLCIDKSPSMEGDKDIWSSAIGLALLDMAHRQHRTFILLGFNHEVPQRVVVRVGRPLPEKELFVPCSGGTDVTNVLDLALNAVETRDVMKRADIIVITDGESDTSKAKWIRKRAKARDVRITGIGIGVKKRSLKPWCDEVHCVTDLNGIDEEGAVALFDK
jgi:uncharacterized protein with von Willebrand factor type A (vWA) domain